MAEGGCSAEAESPAKVRVVRCPKCKKLLPEIAGFSVYRCGGCNAPLQALPAKQEAKDVGCSEKLVGKVERSSGDVRDCVYVEEVSLDGSGVSGCELNGDERVLRERLEIDGVIPSRGDANGSHEDDPVVNGGSRCHPRPSKVQVSNGCFGVEEMDKAEHDRGRGKKLQVESGGGMRQPRQNVVFKHRNAESVLENQSTPRASAQTAWRPTVPDEGSSNFAPRRAHGHDEGDRIPCENSGIPTRVENLEQDRAELLRKLDELREQLSQSCKVVDGLNNTAPTGNASKNLYSNGIHGQNGWFNGGMSSFNRPSAPHSAFMNTNNLHLQSYHPALHPQSEMLGCAMPFGSGMLPGAPYEPHNFCQQRASPNFRCGQFDQDPVMPYHHGAYHHQPSCSCSHFCNQQWQPPSQVRSTALVNRRGPHAHGFYPLNGSLALDPERHNHGVVNSSMISGDPASCQRIPFKNYNGRDCRPLAGGAPFVVCCNCSELLQVPQKHFLMGKGQYKLRCGACCQVILVELDKDGLVVSAPPPPVEPNLHHNRVNGHRKYQTFLDSYNGDYDRSAFNTQFADEEVVLPSYPPHAIALNEMIANGAGMNLAEAENMEGMSSSSSASKGDRSPDAMVNQPDVSNSRELQKAEASSHVPGLPLREHFGYPPTAITSNRTGTGNRSKRSDQEKVVCINGNFKQNSVKDVAVATEMDLLVDEYPNPRLSEDSDEASKEDELPRTSKGGESFFTGLIKKSFKHSENRKFRVSINGHPLPDRVIKKAEKQAGPIQPGEYWYDYRAGFWGVMGQHCLGIIPPFIEEFNYPMLKDCSSGDTGVIVNGRELHQKDLDLLASRGLPTSRERSYIIDISGKVSDVVSGEELDGLGKLAPTVEKMKHGFGMRVLKEMSD